jgi:hypothetical protein
MRESDSKPGSVAREGWQHKEMKVVAAGKGRPGSSSRLVFPESSLFHLISGFGKCRMRFRVPLQANPNRHPSGLSS